MADNDYYQRLSEMNPGELADGLAIEAEFDAIGRGFGKLPTPHRDGQGFEGAVRVGDATNPDEAISKKQLEEALGTAKQLVVATYGNFNATAWATLPSGTYLLFGTGSQITNSPFTLVAAKTYYFVVRHAIGSDLYLDSVVMSSLDDNAHVDIGREAWRAGPALAQSAWRAAALKKGALAPLEALTPAADKVPVFNGPAGAELITLTAFMRTLLDDINAAAALSTLDIADLYKKRNIIGTVSQSGDVPTGAIIERGSNANGEYTKYADGTMECWHGAKFSFSGNAANVNFTWTMPIAHVSGAFIVVSGAQAFENGVLGRRYNRATPSGSYGSGPLSSVNLRLWATGTDTFASGDITDGNVPMYAKGRWF